MGASQWQGDIYQRGAAAGALTAEPNLSAPRCWRAVYCQCAVWLTFFVGFMDHPIPKCHVKAVPLPRAPYDRLSSPSSRLPANISFCHNKGQFLYSYGIIDEGQPNDAGRSQMQQRLLLQPVHDPQSHWMHGTHHPLMKGLTWKSRPSPWKL